jgi:hypothetical protein
MQSKFNHINLPIKGMGLGTYLMSLSYYYDISKTTVLEVWQADKYTERTVSDLINILGLEENIILNKIPEINNYQHTDEIKIFSPFYKPNRIKTYGSYFPVNNNRKPCVVVAMSADGKVYQQYELNEEFPKKRYISLDDNMKLIRLLKKAGFDVINIDSRNTTLEDKFFILNQYADAIIGYGGGLTILAHTLGIPAIIFPWSGSGCTSNGALIYSNDRAHLLHLEKNVYFTNTREILNWSINDLITKLDQLHRNEGGNNFYLNNDFALREHNGDTWIELIKLNQDTSFVGDHVKEGFKIKIYNDAISQIAELKKLERKIALGGYNELKFN